ncbi:uncharacterized protein Z520_06036 [Fonsecaea multimorphosa CBS 102226]|uniref:Mitochondrial cytochrome c oxidase assembly factor n=1 Tax=Fonsecaea multimorphosa CBS 102226 TaxID=1442371 RepID=A0A0D2KMR4_9EURO|nr:uncharacterized protein Z520_06036 [Fonsecaea multimorphosa CBS 102226]KIX97958.1 hypothetical protein Z520_06036 [Fonsecaea multimorphosa CBS 102226]OAL24331.1 hypothetical protein AYO22_05707 [Fonsecaea multimorphosa]
MVVRKFLERTLRGTNLEIFKFGLYLSFPIGYMYYFGTNLENRFAVPGFWPTPEQSHKIPYDKDEIRAEIERHQRVMREQRERRQRTITTDEAALDQAKVAFAAQRSRSSSSSEESGHVGEDEQKETV